MTEPALPTTGFEIAIVGLACRFPGARSPEAFWAALRDGVETIARFSRDELRARGVPAATLDDPDFVPAAGVLDDVELFDAAFFGYSPREAQLTDPQHRMFLQCAWEAMEDAGYDGARFDGLAGVFGGCTMNTYLASVILPRRAAIDFISDQQLMVGNDKDFLTTRVAHKLDLKGVSYTVQSACATSLVAIHVACRSLLAGECDLAIAGAASIRVPQDTGYLYQEGGTSSPDGHCRAFDARAAGSVAGNGVGVVVLRRLDDALAAGDHIYGVIKGSAVTNDGATKAGFAAPTVQGQVRAIEEALQLAHVAGDAVGYVEAHGTGTLLGDPIELSALGEAYRRAGAVATAAIPLGSVKTNIGHLDAAAGMSSLTKVLLAFRHEQVPPSLHFERLNPKVEAERLPFFVNTRLHAWPRGPAPRIAAINSIGMGGTNAHVVLQEAPAAAPAVPSPRPQVLPLSARTPAALRSATRRLHDHLRAHRDANLADVAWTLQVGRRAFEHRRAIVCGSHEDALAALAGDAATPPADARPLLFLLPGQGAQYAGMGAALHEREPRFRAWMERAAELARPITGVDLLQLLHADGADAERMLARTSVAQLALFATEYALAQQLAAWGLVPAALLGHSVGELVAACLAEVMSFEDAVRVVVERGRLMEAMPPGAMLAVQLPAEELEPELREGLCIAAINAPRQCVVSGPDAPVSALEAALDHRGVPRSRLHVSHAYHSSMMEAAAARFGDVLARIKLAPPRVPIFSTVTGELLRAEDAVDPRFWARQLRATVRFRDAARCALAAGPYQALEVGPGRKLSQLVLQCVGPAGVAAPAAAPAAIEEPLPCMRDRCDARDDAAVLRDTVARLWERGAAVTWEGLHEGEQRRRVSLPTYPFELRRYWLDPPPARAAATPPTATPPTATPPAATPPAATPPAATPMTIVEHGAGNSGGLRATITIHSDRIVIETQGAAAASAPAIAAPPEIRAAAPPEVRAAAPPTPPPPTATAAVREPSPPAAAPSDHATEDRVAVLIEELLGLTGVDRRAELLRLGADSLLLTQLLSRVRRSFRISLSMRALLDARTIAGIAAAIDRELRDGAPPAEDRPRAAPPPPAPPADDLARLLEEVERMSPDEVARALAGTRGPRDE